MEGFPPPPERRGGRAPKNPFHRGGGGKEKSGAICTVSSFLEGGGGLGFVTNEKRVERKGRRGGGRRLAPCEGREGRSKEKLLLRGEGGSCLQRHKALPSGWKERGGQKKKTKKKVAPPSPLPFCPPLLSFHCFLPHDSSRRKAGRKRKEKEEEVFVFPVPAGRREEGGSDFAGGRGERREAEDGEDTKYLRSGNYVAGVKRAQSPSLSRESQKVQAHPPSSFSIHRVFGLL